MTTEAYCCSIGVQTSNLVELSTEATEINDVSCNCGNLVSMTTEIYLHRFAVDSIQTIYLGRISPGVKAISGSTCCLKNLVAMATENCFYYFGI